MTKTQLLRVMATQEFLDITVNEKSRDEDYRAYLAWPDSHGEMWELRGYGRTAREAFVDAMQRFAEPEGDRYRYGYLI